MDEGRSTMDAGQIVNLLSSVIPHFCTFVASRLCGYESILQNKAKCGTSPGPDLSGRVRRICPRGGDEKGEKWGSFRQTRQFRSVFERY